MRLLQWLVKTLNPYARYKVRIHLSGGTVVEKWFYKLEWDSRDGKITSLRWAIPHGNFWIDPDTVECIDVVTMAGFLKHKTTG